MSLDLRSQCPLQFPGPLIPASVFGLVSSSILKSASGVVTNVSVGPSSSWYFSLSPFESIMLGLIVLKLMLLRYLNILPLDLNKIVTGESSRRKRSTDPKVIRDKERLAETMFTVLRRLDMQDCLLRTLCELQVHSLYGYKLPRETKLTLSALNKSGWKRKSMPQPTNPDLMNERTVLSVFEEAVEAGWSSKSQNGTECQERYFICPLTKADIISHFETIKVVNVL